MSPDSRNADRSAFQAPALAHWSATASSDTEATVTIQQAGPNASEIELELMDGSTEALFQLAQQLVSSFHLRPSIRSKSARGFDLALGNSPQITKAREMTFDDGATLSDALDDILRSANQHLLENQPVAEDGRDPEGIHQYRVALRRLRSVLGLIRSRAPSSPLDKFRNDAKWLMSNLNDARDWDVFVTQTLPTIAQACPSIDGFDVLGQAAQKQREMAHDKARAAITDPRTGQFQVALGLWVEQRGWLKGAPQEGLALLKGPARAFAVKVLAKLHAKALKRGRHFKKLEPEQRHKLRIAIKKLRYASDFFLPLLGHAKRNRRYAKSLSALQDRLGNYNDVAVTERLVRPLMESKLPLAQAAGALIGWQAGHLSRDGGDLVAAWKKFRSRDPLD